MHVFAQLHALSEFRRRHLPFLKTLEDQDLVREIGHYQALGAPMTLKQLLQAGLTSPATLQRRLSRLKQLGVVQERRSRDDGRALELTLSPGCMRTFAKYGMVLTAQPSLARPRLGRHVCALCDGAESRRDMAVRFLGEGLRQRQRCVVVAPRRMHKAIISGLERSTRNRSVARRLALCGDEKPGATLEFLHGIFRKARADGESIRFVDDMSWAREGGVGFDQLMDFEARLDPMARRFRVDVLCLYDVRRHSGPQLLRALGHHPDSEHYPIRIAESRSDKEAPR
jgi:DcmR-like sensory protein